MEEFVARITRQGKSVTRITIPFKLMQEHPEIKYGTKYKFTIELPGQERKEVITNDEVVPEL